MKPAFATAFASFGASRRKPFGLAREMHEKREKTRNSVEKGKIAENVKKAEIHEKP